MKKFTTKAITLSLCLLMYSLQATAENWLTMISDNAYVRQLSIPGTHDSGTGEGFESSFFDLFARTQDATMKEQWNSGIRAFDLRPTAVQTSKGERYLKIYHGIVETKIRFDEALRFLCSQVSENPGEFAIVIMRHETDGESSDTGNLWEVLVDSCLNAEEFSGKFIPFRSDLKVGDIRGKVLVLSRDKYLNNSRLVGGHVTGWTHSADISDQKNAKITTKNGTRNATLYVQDFYDCTSGRLSTKLSALETMFVEAGKALQKTTGTRIWAINHTSGYTKSASANGYRENAVSTHKAALDFLSSCSPGTPTGIVMMDFAAVDKSKNYEVKSLTLTRALIANNEPYKQDNTGIKEATENGRNIVVTDGYVCAPAPVTVYDLHGRQLGTTGKRVQLPQGRGIFLVKSATGTCRVLTH